MIQFPKFTDYLRDMLLGTFSGKGLEFRARRWLESQRLVKELVRAGAEIATRRNVQGKTRQINFDIYVKVPEQGLFRKGYKEGFVECKHFKEGISDNYISIFQGQVEDVTSLTRKVPLFAYFITSSYFRQSAVDFAKAHPIRAYDGDRYIELWQEREPGFFVKVL